jgi:hypothetical protein
MMISRFVILIVLGNVQLAMAVTNPVRGFL